MPPSPTRGEGRSRANPAPIFVIFDRHVGSVAYAKRCLKSHAVTDFRLKRFAGMRMKNAALFAFCPPISGCLTAPDARPRLRRRFRWPGRHHRRTTMRRLRPSSGLRRPWKPTTICLRKRPPNAERRRSRREKNRRRLPTTGPRRRLPPTTCHRRNRLPTTTASPSVPRKSPHPKRPPGRARPPGRNPRKSPTAARSSRRSTTGMMTSSSAS
jgi:hypothetical protein